MKASTSFVAESRIQKEDRIAGASGQPKGRGRARLARELFAGVYRPGQVLTLPEIGERYGLGEGTFLNTFADLESRGQALRKPFRHRAFTEPERDDGGL
jgi:DNA-binding GntR family transcriptional regulator